MDSPLTCGHLLAVSLLGYFSFGNLLNNYCAPESGSQFTTHLTFCILWAILPDSWFHTPSFASGCLVCVFNSGIQACALSFRLIYSVSSWASLQKCSTDTSGQHVLPKLTHFSQLVVPPSTQLLKVELVYHPEFCNLSFPWDAQSVTKFW